MLPDRMAHQFNTRGDPVHWSPKQDVLGILILAEGFILLIFGLLPAFAHRIPVSLWNLPNRKYWFAEERRERTLSALRCALTWLGCAVLLFVMLTNQSVINYNIPEASRIQIPDMIYITTVFFLFIGGWTLILIRRFRKNS